MTPENVAILCNRVTLFLCPIDENNNTSPLKEVVTHHRKSTEANSVNGGKMSKEKANERVEAAPTRFLRTCRDWNDHWIMETRAWTS